MRYVVLFFMALLLLPACGRKGDLIVPGTVLPQAVTNLTVEPREGVVILAWTMPDKNTDDDPLTDLVGFNILRAEVPEGEKGCPCSFAKAGYIDFEYPDGAVISGRRAAWTDKGPLASGTKYAYKVVPVNKGGYLGREAEPVMVRYLAPPGTPQGLKAAPGNKTVTLSWEKVDDAAGYNIYRTTKSEGNGEASGTPLNAKPVQENRYVDEGLKNGTAYYYRVSALRGTEPPFTEGAPTAEAAVTPAKTYPPPVPSGLRAVPGEGYVLLSWDPNTEPDLKGYKVYRKTGGETAFRPLTETPTGRITYRDDGLTPGATYTYAVTAVDDAEPMNESGLSEAVTVKIP